MATSVLTNLTEVKTFLQETSTTYDTLIELLIPVIIDDITEYTKNSFAESTKYFYDDDWTLTTGGLITKTSTDDIFSEQFIAGDTIRIFNSKWNDDYYTISTVNTSEIQINETLNAESTDSDISIFRVNFPADLAYIASHMIGFNIYSRKYNNQDTLSESIGDYSISYGKKYGDVNTVTIGSNSYPETSAKSLNKYRKVRFS